MSKLGLIIASLFILASSLYLPSYLAEEPAQQPDQDIRALTPEYKARNLTTTLFNEQGLRVHEVSSSYMENYEILGFVLFQQPHYTIYQQSGEPPWQVTANEGTLFDNNVIQLEDNVVIVSENPQDFVQKVTTEYLEIDIDLQTMISDASVEISGPDFVIHSNGVKANLLLKTYELNQHVQTIYQPAN